MKVEYRPTCIRVLLASIVAVLVTWFCKLTPLKTKSKMNLVEISTSYRAVNIIRCYGIWIFHVELYSVLPVRPLLFAVLHLHLQFTPFIFLETYFVSILWHPQFVHKEFYMKRLRITMHLNFPHSNLWITNGISGVTRGRVGVFKPPPPPRNSEVLTKLHLTANWVENV